MPPKGTPKRNEDNRANSFWALATEVTRLEYIKQYEENCNTLHIPIGDFAATKRTLNDKSLSECDSFGNQEILPNILVADETLYTALRIHGGENETLVSSTKSKVNNWPWLVACRSAFLHHETLSLCKIGIQFTSVDF